MPFCVYIVLPVVMYLLVCVHTHGLTRSCGSWSYRDLALDVCLCVWVRVCVCLFIGAYVLYLYVVGQQLIELMLFLVLISDSK